MTHHDVIPPTPLIRRELAEAVRRASILRRLLRLAVEADVRLERVPSSPPSPPPEAPPQGGPRHD